MGQYGRIAVRAAELLRTRASARPAEAWQAAAREICPGSVTSQRKSCPRGAFLGLCEEGLVLGVAPGSYTTSIENKGYAVAAVRLLSQEPALAAVGCGELWRRVAPPGKTQNGQMDVVLALVAAKLVAPIAASRVRA